MYEEIGFAILALYAFAVIEQRLKTANYSMILGNVLAAAYLFLNNSTAFLAQVLVFAFLTPLIVNHCIKKTSSREKEPLVEREISIGIIIAIFAATFLFSQKHAVVFFVSASLAGLALFSMLSRRNTVKAIISIQILETGLALLASSLAQSQIRSFAEVWVAIAAFLPILLVAHLSVKLFEEYKTTNVRGILHD